MYYYMSLYNIQLLTSSLEPLHGFASNFVWMFLGWTPTKFVQIGVQPLSMELWVILCNFWFVCLYFKSLQQRGHLKTAPHLLSLAKGVKLGKLCGCSFC